MTLIYLLMFSLTPHFGGKLGESSDLLLLKSKVFFLSDIRYTWGNALPGKRPGHPKAVAFFKSTALSLLVKLPSTVTQNPEPKIPTRCVGVVIIQLAQLPKSLSQQHIDNNISEIYEACRSFHRLMI